MNQVDIGVIEACESWRLESRFFPSKVGGKPSWLYLKHIPSKKDLECEYCKNPCIFLCQVYAPYEENDEAFHRTLYVFICKNVECCKNNKNGNVKVFRSQLKRENEFYSSSPPVEEENWQLDIKAEKWVKTCQVCRIFAPSQCSKCKVVNYCCREHQKLDWREQHKSICSTQNISKNSSILFPEYELIIEADEHCEDDIDKTDIYDEQEELKKYEDLIKSGHGGVLQSVENIDEDLYQMANNKEDKAFSKFNSQIKKYPDQILRYQRGGEPLYISDNNKAVNVSQCENCNGERQFEFQIMPQLINYLKFEDNFNSLDWGILAIFTCKRSCISEAKYMKEYIWKQDISD